MRDADGRIVQLDRRKGTVLDRAGVTAKFGVPPESIPDYLALVGDSADGFPGLPGWGAKSAGAVLARYGRLEDIPGIDLNWDVDVRGARKLAATLRERFDEALLFRRIATLDARRAGLRHRRGSAVDRADRAVRRAVRLARRAPPGRAGQGPGRHPGPLTRQRALARRRPATVGHSRRLQGGSDCRVHAGSGSLPSPVSFSSS